MMELKVVHMELHGGISLAGSQQGQSIPCFQQWSLRDFQEVPGKGREEIHCMLPPHSHPLLAPICFLFQPSTQNCPLLCFPLPPLCWPAPTGVLFTCLGGTGSVIIFPKYSWWQLLDMSVQFFSIASLALAGLLHSVLSVLTVYCRWMCSSCSSISSAGKKMQERRSTMK